MVKYRVMMIFFVLCFSISLVFSQEIDVKIIPLYGQSKIAIELNFSNLSVIPEEIELELRSSGKSNIIRSSKVKQLFILPSNLSHIGLDMKDLGSGSYEVKVILKDASGSQISDELIKEFNWLTKEKGLEQFEWLNSKEGISEEVLAPFTPIKSKLKGKDLSVDVYGRTYKFRESIFPTSIETKGNSILVGPIRLITKVNGKEVNLRLKDIKIEKETPGIILFSQEASGSALRLSANVQIEYDGMIRIDWKIRSEESLQLDELTFEIPILSKYAKYIYTPGNACKVGFIPKQRWVTGFKPMIWFGDEEVGLEWFCESEKDWYMTKPTRCIEVLPEQDAVILRLHLVDKPIQLKPGNRVHHPLGIPIMQPVDNVVELSYTFGLQATPIKPVIKDVWDYRMLHMGASSLDTKIELYTTERFNVPKSTLDSLATSGVKTVCIHEHWTDIFTATVTSYDKNLREIYDPALKNLIKEFHSRGIQVLLYIGMAIADSQPGWNFFNDEAVLMPRNTWTVTLEGWGMPAHNAPNVCWRSLWQDYIIDGLSKTMMKEYDADGAYLDSTPIIWGGCKNILHGCGYIGSTGDIFRTFSIFPGRQIMKRIYTVVKKHKPDGQVNYHNSSEMLAAHLSFATSYWNGEHLGVVCSIRELSKKSPLLKKIPLDYFRTEFMGYQWGVPAEFLEYTLTDNEEESVALGLLHDIPHRTWRMYPIWKLRDEFKIKESEWLPYWKNKEYITVSTEGDENVYASLHKHQKNGVLVLVSNLGEKGAKVKIKLNLQKLKLKGKLSAFDTIVENLLVDNPITITDGIFEINLDSGKFKIIWVKEYEL